MSAPSPLRAAFDGDDLPGEDELPYDEGPPMESPHHRRTMNDLIDALDTHLRGQGDTSTYTGGNMALYFKREQIEHNGFLGPDFFAVKNTTLRERKSWVVWKEGRAPDVVIELLSPSTEYNDRGHKMKVYAQIMGVADYFLFDPVDGRLEGYRLDRQRQMYVVIPYTADWHVYCAELDLYLGTRWTVQDGEEVPILRWIKPDGTWLPSPLELAAEATRRLLEATARADEATRREEEQTARADEAARREQEQVARAAQEAARAAQEAARADEAARREQEQAARAAQEAARANAAEAQLRELLARLAAAGLG